jgi:hypothetical protein
MTGQPFAGGSEAGMYTFKLRQSSDWICASAIERVQTDVNMRHARTVRTHFWDISIVVSLRAPRPKRCSIEHTIPWSAFLGRFEAVLASR